MTPEQKARKRIDELLQKAGWRVFNPKDANILSKRGVAIRKFPLHTVFGSADYLLYIDGQAAGVIEAKKQGHTLSGVEQPPDKYTNGRPDALCTWNRPLPFAYQSTGVETRFTYAFDPDPRARSVFALPIGE